MSAMPQAVVVTVVDTFLIIAGGFFHASTMETVGRGSYHEISKLQ